MRSHFEVLDDAGPIAALAWCGTAVLGLVAGAFGAVDPNVHRSSVDH